MWLNRMMEINGGHFYGIFREKLKMEIFVKQCFGEIFMEQCLREGLIE